MYNVRDLDLCFHRSTAPPHLRFPLLRASVSMSKSSGVRSPMMSRARGPAPIDAPIRPSLPSRGTEGTPGPDPPIGGSTKRTAPTCEGAAEDPGEWV